MILSLWTALTTATTPLLRLWLHLRTRAGKEDPARGHERRGKPRLHRPAGRLLWVHGASVGESLSALPLINRFLRQSPGWSVLVSTGTVTSARLMGERLPVGALHQFIPLDQPHWAQRFLGHWQPNACIWLESDLWPNLLHATSNRGIPLVLANARMSARSFRRWKRVPRTARELLGRFSTILAPDAVQAARFAILSGVPVQTVGNLKDDAPPLPFDPAQLQTLQGQLANRPVWCAASTHAGEETTLLAAHQQVLATCPDALLVLVPRHPHRGAEVAALSPLPTARRSMGEAITPQTAVYVADTMGELGLFYRLAPVVFIGGSLIPHGGQNPLEAALLDSALLYGPHMDNFTDIARALADAATVVTDAVSLATQVVSLLQDGQMCSARATAARTAIRERQGATDKTLAVLQALLHNKA